MVSLEPSIGIVRIIPLYTGEFIDVKLAEWSSWLDEKLKNSNIPEFEEETIYMLIPVLVKRFPTDESILEMVDWENKQALFEKYTFERKQAEEKEIEEIKIYNQRLNEFNNSRLKCPKCENKNVRFLDRSPDRKSYFICKSCGRSFRLEDIESMK